MNIYVELPNRAVSYFHFVYKVYSFLSVLIKEDLQNVDESELINHYGFAPTDCTATAAPPATTTPTSPSNTTMRVFLLLL